MNNRNITICEEVTKQIADLVEVRVNDLSQLWRQTFDEQIYEQHVRALVGHVTQFFDEVFEESSMRQAGILDKIQCLRDEAENLKRLLGVEIELNASPNLPYYSIQCELDQNLEDLRRQLNDRRSHIRAYLEEQEELVESLGENPRPLLDDPLPSEEEMHDFRRYLDDLKIERLRRTDVMRNLRQSIEILARDLGIQLPLEEINMIHNEQLPPTMRNMSKLERIEQELSQQFEEMKSEIDKYRSKLLQLWEFLQVGYATRQKFDKFSSYNQTTYDILYQEFNRCEAIKRENIEKYVHKIRQEIINCWDVCYKSTEERERFSPFNSKTYNEDLLTLHELELNELKEFYEQYRHIFGLYEERKQLWEQMDALEKKKTDPNRYNNRGGQLLKEEKERKMLSVRIPKIEAQLLELCAEYESRTNKPFTIDGKIVQAIIEEDYEKREEEKASRKKVAGTPMSVSRFAGTRATPQTGSALKNMTRNNVMLSATRTFSAAKKPVNSASHSNLKRKLSPSSAKRTPAAKRNILTQMSGSSFLRPTGSALKVKSPAKSLKRRSIKRLSIKSNKRLSKKRNNNDHRTAAGSDTSGHSESISYDLFEHYVTKNTPMRSSVLPTGSSRQNNNENLRNTPRKVPHIKITRSSQAARSPSPGGSERKKLTAKTIPIIF